MIFIKSLGKSIYKYSLSRFFKVAVPHANKVAGKDILSAENANSYIFNKISSGEPFMAGRYGGCENDILACYYINQNTGLPIPGLKFNYLCSNAGFFPNDISLLKRYVDLMEDAAKNVDILGTWNWLLEDYIIKKFASQSQLTTLGGLEPWFVNNPWSEALKGKRVLVIHPFKDSIELQYKNRSKLFSNSKTLPDFELITLKAIQSIAGNKPEGFTNWFEALDHMTNQIKDIDFDVAIIGCGAYGFPLASRVKEMGKQAIHLAGATQLLFGIKGSRWEKGNYKDVFKDIFNENWIRPLENEKPKGSGNIEGSCYW